MEPTIEQALQLGVAAHRNGNLQEAERHYRAVLQSQPTHPDANYNLGVITLYANKVDAALPLFKAAVQAKPGIEQYWASYIDALVKNNQVKIAKQAIKKAKKKGIDAKKLEALLSQPGGATGSKVPSQAQLSSLLECYQSGRYAEAETLARSISQEFPRHSFSWKILGVVLSRTGRSSEAVFAGQKAVEIAPEDAEAHFNLSIALQDMGRLDEAEASLIKAVTLKPDFVEAHYNLGNTLKELERYSEAEVSYKKTIALKPDFAEIYSNLGIVLHEMGRLDEAEASYKQAIALRPDLALVYSNLGNTLRELGRLEEAEASFRQAIALQSDFAEAYYNLGITLKALDRLDDAEESYTQAIALKPDFDEALRNRSVLLFNKNEYEAALRDADLIEAKDVGEFDLTTLYAMGRTEDIYKRIEKHAEDDGENISIAAFAAFIAEVEKKSTAYNFCPNPLDFIHVANLSSHVKDSVAYIAEVIEELDKVVTVWEPSDKTTVGGFQSPENMNLFSNSSEKIAQLKSIIIDELETYRAKFQNETCSYIQKWPSGNNLFGWHVILKQQGHQRAHIHTGGWLSGVIYLKVVPSLGHDEGAIEFSLNGKYYHDANSPSRTHQPELGDIVFFPSSLYHRTIPFSTDTNRIVVAFDLIPKAAEH